MTFNHRIGRLPQTFSCGRITLTSGDPTGATPVTAGTTLYFAPFLGNAITLLNAGGAPEIHTFTEKSLAVPNVANTMYDLFGYINNGMALEALAWSSDSARATNLTRSNGILVKSGDVTRRYLGSFRTLSAGQTDDSPSSRCVWNNLNRLQRRIQKSFDAASWTYNTTGAWRSANDSTANRINFVIGVTGEIVFLRSMMTSKDNAGITTWGHIGIALNATNANDAVNSTGSVNNSALYTWRQAIYNGVPPIGYNYLQATEALNGVNTQTVTFAPTLDTNNVGDMQGFIIN